MKKATLSFDSFNISCDLDNSIRISFNESLFSCSFNILMNYPLLLINSCGIT